MFWALSLQGFSLKGFRGGLLSNDKSRALTLSSHRFMVEGWDIYSQEATRPDLSEMTLVTKELTHVQCSDFKHTWQLDLGYK